MNRSFMIAAVMKHSLSDKEREFDVRIGKLYI